MLYNAGELRLTYLYEKEVGNWERVTALMTLLMITFHELIVERVNYSLKKIFIIIYYLGVSSKFKKYDFRILNQVHFLKSFHFLLCLLFLIVQSDISIIYTVKCSKWDTIFWVFCK